MTRLFIVGAGGFGREVLLYAREVIARNNDFEIGGFLDSNPHALKGFETGTKILGDERSWNIEPQDRFVIATGDPELRARLHTDLVRRSAQFMTIIHPLAWIAPSAKIGLGTIVGAFATVNADATVGENVVIQGYAGIGHDAQVGAHSAICSFTLIAGAAEIGERAFIAPSCVVTPKKVVGRQATVSAGSVIHKSVPDNALAVGNPAVIHKNWRKLGQ